MLPRLEISGAARDFSPGEGLPPGGGGGGDTALLAEFEPGSDNMLDSKISRRCDCACQIDPSRSSISILGCVTAAARAQLRTGSSRPTCTFYAHRVRRGASSAWKKAVLCCDVMFGCAAMCHISQACYQLTGVAIIDDSGMHFSGHSRPGGPMVLKRYDNHDE